MKRDELLERTFDVILFLSEDTDFICEQIHRNGGSEWREKNCGEKCCPDATCVKAWIENYYDEVLVKMLVGKD